MHGAIGAAVTQAMRILAPLDRLTLKKSHGAVRGRYKTRKPITFVTYHDPQDRFELSYPSEWTLQRARGIHVLSPRLSSFARVSIHPASGSLCTRLLRVIERAGGTAELKTTNAASPERVRGPLMLGRYRYACDATAWTVGRKKVVLLIGNVTHPQRSAGIERYENRVLSAIRRNFKVGRGLRQKKR